MDKLPPPPTEDDLEKLEELESQRLIDKEILALYKEGEGEESD